MSKLNQCFHTPPVVFEALGDALSRLCRLLGSITLISTVAIPGLTAMSLADERQAVIVVVGAEGTPEFGQQFREWGERWKQAAHAADAELIEIGTAPVETSDVDTAVDQAPESDLQQLRAALSQCGTKQTSEPLWLVMIGHGTFDTRKAQFNLKGPDLSEAQLAEWCRTLQRPLAVINCSSCSSPFLNALSGPDRVIVTATKDASQIQYSRFGDAMSRAVTGLDADINRDGQTSLLEAWLFASRRTAEFYESEGRLATEHSLLDDTGDARGVRAELFDGFRISRDVKNSDEVDGQLAARWHLLRSAEERRLTADERQRRDQLEAVVERLRRDRGDMSEDQYLSALQNALVPLAELYEQVDARNAVRN